MNEILLIGIIFSLIYTELTDLSPGGMIVPAYFAMYSYDWERMVGTILISGLCILIVHFLSKYMILYGRRRYAVFIFSGILLKYMISLLGFGASFSIGSLIPGILGRDMERQKPIPTLLSLGIVTALTCLAGMILH